jgi:hypothetical protein
MPYIERIVKAAENSTVPRDRYSSEAEQVNSCRP